MITLLKNSLANLKGHKLRLVIAFVWIIIGITSVVLVSASGNAMSAVIKQSFQTLSPRTAIIYFEPSDESYDTNQILFDPFTNSDVQILTTLDGVEKIKTSDKMPTIGMGGSFMTSEESVDFSYYNTSGYGVIMSSSTGKCKIIKGREITPADEGRKVVVLESRVADEIFGDDEDPIGKGVTIKGLTYEVIGICDSEMVYDVVEKEFSKRSVFDLSSPFSVVPDAAFNMISGKAIKSGSINHIIVTVKEDFDIENVSSEITAELLTLHPNIMGEYKVQDRTTIQKSTEEMTRGIDKFVKAITVISMIVGGVGIMNIMYVSVMERNKEIGIRRALGAKPSTILLQFLVESVFITTVGGILGIVVGYAVTIYSKNFLPFKPIPSLNTLFYSFIVIVLTGVIFGLVPAYKASKVDPVKIIYK